MFVKSGNGGADAIRVAVIGAGVIGLTCALELKRRRADVSVYERGPELGAGVTVRSAGMLGAGFEWALGDQASLAAWARRAGELWPEFAASLGAVEYSGEGALVVARTAAEVGWIDSIAEACAGRGLAVERLSGSALRRLESALSTDLPGGLLLPGDRQVDARLVLARLAEAFGATGGGLRLGRQWTGWFAGRVSRCRMASGSIASCWRPGRT